MISLDLTFTDIEARHVCCPYDEAMVVILTLVGLNVYWILVDNGSLVKALYKQALDKMEVKNLEIKPISTPLSEFTGYLTPMGEVILSLSMGELTTKVIEMTRFLVVDYPSAYNTILGRLVVHNFKAVPFTYITWPSKSPPDVGLTLSKVIKLSLKNHMPPSLRNG